MSTRADGSVRKKSRAPRAGWNPEEPPLKRFQPTASVPATPLALRKVRAGATPPELLQLGEDLYHPLVVEKHPQLVQCFSEWGAANIAAACCSPNFCSLACRVVRECEPIRLQICALEAALSVLLVRALDSRVTGPQELEAHSCCRQAVDALSKSNRVEITTALVCEEAQLCMLLNDELCDATFVHGLVVQAEAVQRKQFASVVGACVNSATAVRLVQQLAVNGPFAADWCHQLLYVQGETKLIPARAPLIQDPNKQDPKQTNKFRAHACSALVLNQPLSSQSMDYGSCISDVLRESMEDIGGETACHQADLIAAYCAWHPMHTAALDHIATEYLQKAPAIFERLETATIVHTQVVLALERALRSRRECLISAVLDRSPLRTLMTSYLTSSSKSAHRSHLFKIAQCLRVIDGKYLNERSGWSELLVRWFAEEEQWGGLVLSPCAIVPSQLRPLPASGKVGVDEVH